MYTSSNATVDFNNVTFSENKAVVNESGSGGNGGALYIYDANVKWNNVDFYNNEAANNGGACYLGVSDLRVDVTCDFKGNTALVTAVHSTLHIKHLKTVQRTVQCLQQSALISRTTQLLQVVQ